MNTDIAVKIFTALLLNILSMFSNSTSKGKCDVGTIYGDISDIFMAPRWTITIANCYAVVIF